MTKKIIIMSQAAKRVRFSNPAEMAAHMAAEQKKIDDKNSLLMARKIEHNRIMEEFIPFFYTSLNNNTENFLNFIKNFTDINLNGVRYGGDAEATTESICASLIPALNERVKAGVIFTPSMYSFTSNGDRRLNISVIGKTNTGNHFTHSILLAKGNDKGYWLPTFIELVI